MLDNLFQVRTTYVSLGKELMMFLMEYYTSYFISPEAPANTTQEDAVIKVNSFKTHETCSRQALVKKEDLIPVQVFAASNNIYVYAAASSLKARRRAFRLRRKKEHRRRRVLSLLQF